jgi:cystathionine gamma-synthase
VEPIDRSTTWPHHNGEPGPFTYSRFSHPTQADAERALGELEGGSALLFPSGMGASTAVLLGLLEPGAEVALAADAYYGTGVLLRELERWGIRHTLFDQAGPPPPEADLVWIESPSNPFLTMPNFAAAADHPARVVCDATASTPVYLRALELGCDVVVHSATKYLTGHHDCMLGAVVLRAPDDAERLHDFRTKSGIVAGPDAAWLLRRGLDTLGVRMERSSATAGILAQRLAAHPAVATVRWPGFGGLLSFDVADADTARRVETSTRLITNATSLGGVRSLIESRHRWEGARVPTGLLRLSVGLEDPELLWADLEQALNVS